MSMYWFMTKEKRAVHQNTHRSLLYLYFSKWRCGQFWQCAIRRLFCVYWCDNTGCIDMYYSVLTVCINVTIQCALICITVYWQCVLMYDKGPSADTQTSPGLTQCDYPTVSWLAQSSLSHHHIIISSYHHIFISSYFLVIIWSYDPNILRSIIQNTYSCFVNQVLLIKLSLQRINVNQVFW